MLEIPATEVAKRVSRDRQAAQHEPVAVIHHSGVSEVLTSKCDYDEYLRLKSLVTRAVWVEDLRDELVTALTAARVDPRHDHLTSLLDE